VLTSYKVIVKEIYLGKVGMRGSKFYFGWFKMAGTVYIQRCKMCIFTYKYIHIYTLYQCASSVFVSKSESTKVVKVYIVHPVACL
jgi:hypothetical protein